MATIEPVVQSLYYNNCFSVVIATLLVYDYLMMIGREVEYVWQRPMSLMSFLYYVVRYLGLFVGIVGALCTGFYIFYNLGSYVIIWMSAAVMVLRIFAMYNRSKVILSVLLLFFVPSVVTTLVIMAKFFNISSAKSDVIAFDVLGTNYCAQVSLSRAQSLMFIHLTIPRICFDVLLVVLAVGRLVKEAVHNRVSGKWQPNVYLRMLARDSTVYFILNLAFTIVDLTLSLAVFPVSNPTAPIDSRVPKYGDIQILVQYVAITIIDTVPFMLVPHLIIRFRYHTKADAMHSGFASHLGTSLGAGKQEMCFARSAPTSSMDGRDV
ncbi:hypothetical protein BV22DRAFT_1133425 [Leucogyrophana mollusca]|uniref:Uncharacterized protein n=1 Tax=Leucogyrophana mollusca TaxID=85980 RepID=A0ACB8B549_9AGAM|nr:hypothetical protein BV22DRAFT_1133425 [Leucogyrophana mollusca]